MCKLLSIQMAADVVFPNNEIEDDTVSHFYQVFQRLRGFKITDKVSGFRSPLPFIMLNILTLGGIKLSKYIMLCVLNHNVYVCNWNGMSSFPFSTYILYYNMQWPATPTNLVSPSTNDEIFHKTNIGLSEN